MEYGGIRVTTVTHHQPRPAEISPSPGESWIMTAQYDDPRIDTIWTALSTVIDPELGLDVVTLGLVYGVEVDGPAARVVYTLTTPGCPMERTITQGVRDAALGVVGIDRVDTEIVWEPAWNPGMIAPGALS